MTRLLVLVLLPLLLLAGCTREYEWQQKLIVTVETPMGQRSGESVLAGQMRVANSALLPPEARGAFISLQGEAVVVEVAPGRYLFALLNGMPYPFRVFFPDEAPVDVANRVETLRDSRKLSPKNYPFMVTFDDVTDPTTVRQVDPLNLAASFGPGVALTSVTLEMTDEPRTSGKLKAVLGWIDQAKFIIPPEQQPRLGSDQTFEQRLMRQDFIDRRTLKDMRD